MATPTAAKAWKSQAAAGIELTLPSENVCLVRRPGIEEIMTSGVVPDELSSIVMKTIKGAQTGRPQDHQQKKAAEGEIDPKDLQKMFKTTEDVFRLMDSFDKITEMCVLEPKVKWHKREVRGADGHIKRDDKEHPVLEVIPQDERDEDVLYTDIVDMDDKMFIFNYVVGGSTDLEQFRQEYGDSLASVSAG